jgi:hypothetical protein
MAARQAPPPVNNFKKLIARTTSDVCEAQDEFLNRRFTEAPLQCAFKSLLSSARLQNCFRA